MVFRVYRLKDPATGETRYVGVTKYPVLLRVAQHMCSDGRYSPGLREWLHTVVQQWPLPDIAEEISNHTLFSVASVEERKWIRYYQIRGALFNVQGTPKNVDAHKGRRGVCTPRMLEHLHHLASSKRGTKMHAQGRANISAGLKAYYERRRSNESPLTS
jgi:hypothetical protein